MNFLTKFIARFPTETRVQMSTPFETPPQLTRCNEFMRNFCESVLPRIEVSPEAIDAGSHEVLRPLACIPFETICNRFRVLSNLELSRIKKRNTAALSSATGSTER